MKRVALVFPTKILPNAFYNFILPPLGLERIAAHLEDIAEVQIFDLRFEKHLVSKLKHFNPDIIGVNIKTTMHAAFNYSIAQEIRQALPKVPIVMGGLHATHCYEEALAYCDFVLRGEGELSFRDFVLGKNHDEISGLCYQKDGKIIANPLKAPEGNLDTLRPPARHLRNKKYYYGLAPLFRMDLLETSRGCTHYCTFCSPAATYPACYRAHSPEYVLSEVKKIVASGVHFCWLTDDQLGGDLDRLERICDLIIDAKLSIVFFAFIRPFLGRMELKRKMVKAGFVMLSYGAESPQPSQLLRYGKGHPDEKNFIRDVNNEFREAGVIHLGNSYVFGDPLDSRETISHIGEYARTLGPNYIEPLYAQPYPGTRYREELKEKGLLLERPWSDFTEARLLVKHPELNEKELKELRVKVWLDFLSPKRFFMQMGVPLCLYKRAGISRLRVLLFMKRVEKVAFGCLLEDKIYSDCYEQMVRDYFHTYVCRFEKEEMDFRDSFEDMLELLGLNFLKRLLNNKTIVVNICEGHHFLTAFVVSFRDRKLLEAYATTENKHYNKALEFSLPLGLLAKRLASESLIWQSSLEILIGVYNFFRLQTLKNLRVLFFK